ncbi:hypothetical protein QBC39DRAFT_138917 [Podospora conica]|nr:hypothetical protein QBC39DRAFT_138917 [Schizothecium conicum]
MTLRFLVRSLWFDRYSSDYTKPETRTKLGSQLLTVALTYLDYGLFHAVVTLASTDLHLAEILLHVRLAISNSDFEFERISHSLLEFLQKYLQVLKLTVGCRTLASIGADQVPEIRNWIAGRAIPVIIKRYLASPVGSQDGIELVRLVQAYHNNTEYFEETIVPILIQKQQSSPFLLAAIHTFAHAMPSPDRETHANHLTLYTSLAAAAIVSMDIPALIDIPALVSPSKPLPPFPLYARHLADLLTRCTAIPPLASLSTQLLDNLAQTASDRSAPFPSHFWLSLLKRILPALHPAHRPLARAILVRHIVIKAGRAPLPSAGPSHRRAPINCPDRCSDCKTLSAFLEAKGEKKWSFTATKVKDWRHFEKVALRHCEEKLCTVKRSGERVTVEKKVVTNEMRKAGWEKRVRRVLEELGETLELEGVREVLGGEYEGVWEGWGEVNVSRRAWCC